MRLVDYAFDLPALKRFTKDYKAGSTLFKQGDTGQTLFLVLQGLIELRVNRQGEDRLVSVVEAGQFLGEKALLKKEKFKRAFSASARTDVRTLEISAQNLDEMEKSSPEVLIAMMKRMFQTATLRLERSNFLIHVLRSSNNIIRFVQLLYFFCQCYGRKRPEGTEVPIFVDGIRYYIDMEIGQIENCMNELSIKNLIKRLDDGAYIVPNEQKLLAYADTLSTQFKTGWFDELEPIP